MKSAFYPGPAIIVILCGVVAALHVGKLPPAIPVLRDALGITLVEAGFLLSMVQLAGMLAGVLVGAATDGIGLRRSVLAGLLILAGASLAGMWATQPGALLWLRALEGMGFLLVVLAAPSLIRQLVPLRQLAQHLGLWGAYMPTGIALALLGGPAVMAPIGWPAWWGLLGAVSLAMAGWAFLRVPSDTQRAAAAPVPTLPVEAEPWSRRLGLTLTRPGPWRVALAFLMYSSQWMAIIGFLPSIYAQAGLGGSLVGALTALACIVNVIGNVGAGRLVHLGIEARHLLYVGFVTMAVSTVIAFGAFIGDAPVVRYVAVLLFSSVSGLVPGALFSLAVRVAPSERTVSTTVGWMQQCSSTGQFIGPPIVAWLAGEVGGWHWTWTLTALASVAGLMLARGLPSSKRLD